MRRDDDPWHVRAACHDHPDADVVFFPTHMQGCGWKRACEAAFLVCYGCLARSECLEDTLTQERGPTRVTALRGVRRHDAAAMWPRDPHPQIGPSQARGELSDAEGMIHLGCADTRGCLAAVRCSLCALLRMRHARGAM